MDFNDTREKELEELKMWKRDVEIAGVDFPFKEQCSDCKFLKIKIVRLSIRKKQINGEDALSVGPKVVCCEFSELCKNAVAMDYRMRRRKKKDHEEANK